MSQIEDRVTRLETLIETHLSKIVEGIDSLSIIMLEVEDSKQFRRDYESLIKKEIENRLATKKFDDGVKKTVEDTLAEFLQRDKVREDFSAKVKAIFEAEMNKRILWVYIKISVIIGGLLLGFVSSLTTGG